MNHKKRKIKYYQMRFKISANELNVINNYCEAGELTHNKLVKKALREYFENHKDELKSNDPYHNIKQLSLFDTDIDDDEDEDWQQLTIDWENIPPLE